MSAVMNAAPGAMKAPVYTELAECQDCYKCIRKCPVKSIKVEQGQASILVDRCIYCGRCVVNCPARAKHYRNDVEKVKLLLESGRKAVVSLAPSFVSEFTAWKPEELVAALKKLGFSAVSETALGADFLSARIARDWAQNAAQAGPEARLMISSACPAIVEYIKLYDPHLAPYIAPHASPLLAHARFLRSRYGADTAVVFVGPCIAKKHEADLYAGEIDAAVTFAELDAWLQKERVTQKNVSVSSGCEFEPRRSAKGAFFPIEGGEITAFSAYLAGAAAKTGARIRTVSVSGIQAVRETLAGFDPASLESPLFMELLACSGGCVNGPGMTGAVPPVIRQIRLRDYAQSADDTLDAASLSLSPLVDADYPRAPLSGEARTEREISEALTLVGKYSLADRLNCASCGYNTCRDFAAALLDGRAEKSMCASYMRKLANKTANGLIKMIPSGVVIVDRDLKIIDCNEQFARLLGTEAEELFSIQPGLEGADLKKMSPFPQYFQAVIDPAGPEVAQSDVRDGNKIFHLTAFSIEKGAAAAGVLEDITEPRVRIEKTVERARELIKKNVSTVQQIAFLLGENAAESEAILNSIIESYTVGEEDAC
jgi:iron only hydrogenase large subunit-like protein/PAS domain-containing protein